MPKARKRGKNTRPPRIRVPNNERALFTVDGQKLVGVVKRLSLSGGSTVLSKGAVPQGTIAEMLLRTVFGNVTAQVEFLHTGADGMAHCQAFRFLGMDDVSSQRFTAAAQQMQRAGFSDAEESEDGSLSELASQSLSKLGENLRRLSVMITPRRPNPGGLSRSKH